MKFDRKLQKGGRISLPKKLIKQLGLKEGQSNLTIRVFFPANINDEDYSNASTWYINITSGVAEAANGL